MLDFNYLEECYSCFACLNICPTQSIKFDKNLHPVINEETCIKCKKCEKICIKLNEKNFQENLTNEDIGYICKNKNIHERKKSSSGGMFILLAKEILKRKGYVCGCIFDENLMPKHILSNRIEDINKMLGSKYVMSNLNNYLNEIEKLLKQKIPVLFVGVPCQTAVIKKYFFNSPTLYVVSVVCHGSIKREYWKKYLELEEKIKSKKIVDISMRDKRKGWLNYGMKIKFENGDEKITYRKSDGYFLKCFTDGLFDRERCLTCKYKGSEINTDILLGDAWGVKELCRDFVDEWGYSSVVCLSDRGQSLFNQIKEFIEFREVKLEEIIKRNKRIISPPQENFLRKSFENKYKKNPEKLIELCEYYSKENFLRKLIRYLINFKYKRSKNV